MAISCAAILKAAKSAGLTLDLVDDKIRVTGPDEAVARLRPALVANRTSIVETLREQRTAERAKGEEAAAEWPSRWYTVEEYREAWEGLTGKQTGLHKGR